MAEKGVTFRDIAEAILRARDVPVKSIDADAAADHVGWHAGFRGRRLPGIQHDDPRAARLTGPTLVNDLDAGAYTDGKPADWAS